MKYRIYKSVNAADTCRDPDDIHIAEVGEAETLSEAKKIAKEYIKKHFSRSDAKLTKDSDGTFSAMDFCSYPMTIVVERND